MEQNGRKRNRTEGDGTKQNKIVGHIRAEHRQHCSAEQSTEHCNAQKGAELYIINRKEKSRKVFDRTEQRRKEQNRTEQN